VERIKTLLADAELDIKDIVAFMDVAPERVVAVVEKMIAEGEISESKFGKLKING
jgi:hypothetical protein